MSCGTIDTSKAHLITSTIIRIAEEYSTRIASKAESIVTDITCRECIGETTGERESSSNSFKLHKSCLRTSDGDWFGYDIDEIVFAFS